MTAHLLSSNNIVGERYKILSFVGEGGMQQVFKAVDSAFDRLVAVKAPKNSSAVKRFQRSAKLSASINHANVAKTLDYIPTEDSDYLVEEFIDGRDLRDVLNADFLYFDPHVVAHVLHHLAKGAAASHHADVFHRDLKPSNVMVSRDAGLTEVKITDFGIAKMAREELLEAMEGASVGKEDSLGASQTAMGALPYMAPELISEPKKAGAPADIWSLGAMAYQMMTGVPPFGTGLMIVPKILQGQLPPKPEIPGNRQQFQLIWDALWELIQSCMQKDVAKRIDADQLCDKCAELCYSSAPRLVGEIIEYKKGPGSFGKIRDAKGQSHFFHINSFLGTLPKKGMRVAFASFPGAPHDRAFPVTPMK